MWGWEKEEDILEGARGAVGKMMVRRAGWRWTRGWEQNKSAR